MNGVCETISLKFDILGCDVNLKAFEQKNRDMLLNQNPIPPCWIPIRVNTVLSMLLSCIFEYIHWNDSNAFESEMEFT